MGFGVRGLGFGVWALWFEVWGVGFEVYRKALELVEGEAPRWVDLLRGFQVSCLECLHSQHARFGGTLILLLYSRYRS